MFESLHTYAHIETGEYTSISSVLTNNTIQYTDKMERFWSGKTLKHLSLLFSGNDKSAVLLLDEYVFSTKARPLPVLSLL